MDCSPPGSSVHGIFLAGILEWVAVSSSRQGSNPHLLCLLHRAGKFFTNCASWEATSRLGITQILGSLYSLSVRLWKVGVFKIIVNVCHMVYCVLTQLVLPQIQWGRYLLCPPFTGDFPGSSKSEESACSAGDQGLIPESGRSCRKGNGNPLHYSCLENPEDRRVWQATVQGVVESDMTEQLSTGRSTIYRRRNMRHRELKSLPNITQRGSVEAGILIQVIWLFITRLHFAGRVPC